MSVCEPVWACSKVIAHHFVEYNERPGKPGVSERRRRNITTSSERCRNNRRIGAAPLVDREWATPQSCYSIAMLLYFLKDLKKVCAHTPPHTRACPPIGVPRMAVFSHTHTSLKYQGFPVSRFCLCVYENRRKI